MFPESEWQASGVFYFHPLFSQHHNILTFKMVLLTYDMVLDSYRGLVTKQATTNSCNHVSKSMSLVTAIWSAINKTLKNFCTIITNIVRETPGVMKSFINPLQSKKFTSGFRHFNWPLYTDQLKEYTGDIHILHTWYVKYSNIYLIDNQGVK